jgi:3-oxoacyl-[acyl-carrier protein] reductase
MKENANSSLVILITGSSKGIGRYLAQYFLEAGHTVIGCSRSNTDLDAPNYHHFKTDITVEDEILAIFKHIRLTWKKLDVLINNAAINPAILSAALLPTDTVEKTFKTNVVAPIIFCREAVKIMSRNKFGRIINMGSMAAAHHVPGEALYTSTKAAINAYTKVLSKEVYRAGITANVVAPSAIETDLSAKINQVALKEVLSRNAVATFGNFKDVSNAIHFLIKMESDAVTGQIIYLGGV